MSRIQSLQRRWATLVEGHGRSATVDDFVEELLDLAVQEREVRVVQDGTVLRLSCNDSAILDDPHDNATAIFRMGIARAGAISGSLDAVPALLYEGSLRTQRRQDDGDVELVVEYQNRVGRLALRITRVY